MNFTDLKCFIFGHNVNELYTKIFKNIPVKKLTTLIWAPLRYNNERVLTGLVLNLTNKLSK